LRGHAPHVTNRPTWAGFHHVAIIVSSAAPKAQPTARPTSAPTLRPEPLELELELEDPDVGALAVGEVDDPLCVPVAVFIGVDAVAEGAADDAAACVGALPDSVATASIDRAALVARFAEQ